MSIIHAPSKRTKRSLYRRGFTLVELMVSVTVLSIALAGTASSLLFLMRSNYSIMNLTTINNEARHFLQQVGQDLRSAVDVTQAGDRSMWLVTEDPDGNQSEVKYIYNETNGVLTRQVVGKETRTLIQDVTWMHFYYYNSQDVSTTNMVDMKKVNITVQMASSQIGVVGSKREFRSSRFVLRNRQLTN